SLPLLSLAAEAGRVDELERPAVVLEQRVDRVAGGAGDLGDDRPLRTDEPVVERRLADVRPSEDRDAERVAGDGASRLARQQVEDLVQEIGRVGAEAGR